MTRYSRYRTIDRAVHSLLSTGAWIVKSTKRHVRLENISSKLCLTVPGTPSDHRATQNWLHQVRRLTT